MKVNLSYQILPINAFAHAVVAPDWPCKTLRLYCYGRIPDMVKIMGSENYWYEEGAYAYKAGIELDDLDEHFPSGKMTRREWRSLQTGWVAKQNEFFEDMGQGRLF